MQLCHRAACSRVTAEIVSLIGKVRLKPDDNSDRTVFLRLFTGLGIQSQGEKAFYHRKSGTKTRVFGSHPVRGKAGRWELFALAEFALLPKERGVTLKHRNKGATTRLALASASVMRCGMWHRRSGQYKG
jgi:hypothetical protein